MKLAFSTLACPESSGRKFIQWQRTPDLDGIEIRGLGQEIFCGKSAAFYRCRTSGKHYRSCTHCVWKFRAFLPTGCLARYGKSSREREEISQYIDLAQKLDAPYIRILADLAPMPECEVDDEAVAAQLRDLAPMAEKAGVTLLVETNGVLCGYCPLGRLLEMVSSDAVAALWDMHHPYRFFGESPEKTIQNLGGYIRYVHVKDSVMEDGRVSYRMMGEGDLPIDAMMQALRSVCYDGYISLEWVKRWSGDLSDAGIVFPQFVHYMEKYTGRGVTRSVLFKNKAGTGQYIWEKDTLIDLTFPQVLDRMAEEFPDQPAFRFTTLDYSRTYAQFRDDVDAFARALLALGVKKGDKVAIWATNVPQWYLTFWTTVKIGAVLVTVNTAYKIHEAEYLLRQSDTHTLVMIEGFKDSPVCGDHPDTVSRMADLTPGRAASFPEAAVPAQRYHSRIPAGGLLTWEGGGAPKRARASRWNASISAWQWWAATTSAISSTPPARRGSRKASCSRITMW